MVGSGAIAVPMPQAIDDASKIGAAVEVQGLSKNFAGQFVVQDVGFRIEAGAFLTLLGPSGSGKTTTLRMIAGFETPTTGSVHIGNQDITHKAPHKRDIGVVFQQFALFPHMTVFKNVAYPLEMRSFAKHKIKQRVTATLSLVGLSDLANRYPKQLSGGQQQRVAVARAIVFDPPVMLMDESLGSLDRRLRESMQIELRHLQKRLGITTIAVTHDQVEAIVMSDVIAIMDQGKLQQIGSPLDIYRRPANRFVAEFIGESNLMEGSVRARNNSEAQFVTKSGANITVLQDAQFTNAEYLLIRPEFVRLLPTSSSMRNQFDAVVLDIISLGEIVKYRLLLPSGDEVVAKTLISSADHSWTTGSRVKIGWEIKDCLLINAETRSKSQWQS
jgi:putative spermidine/putrescine transport system ATP-binding protein